MTKFILLLLCIFSVSALGASFDCKLPSLKKQELEICANQELSSLDETLSSLYKYLTKESVNKQFYSAAKNDIKKSQASWISDRNKCLALDCIRKSYVDRIKELSNTLAGHSQPTQKFLLEFFNNVLKFNDGYSSVDISIIFNYRSKQSKSTYLVHYKGMRTGTGFCGSASDDYFVYFVVNNKDNSIEEKKYISTGGCFAEQIAFANVVDSSEGFKVIVGYQSPVNKSLIPAFEIQVNYEDFFEYIRLNDPPKMQHWSAKQQDY